MALLGFELLFRLTWGLLLSVIFVRRTESSEKFVKIASRFSWGLGGAAAFFLWVSHGTHGELAETAAFQASQMWNWGALLALCLGFQAYTSILAVWGRVLGFVLVLLSPVLLNWGMGAESLRFTVTSGLVLGGFFGGQFLGHWYLNVPGMHIVELKRLVNFLFAGMILKTLEMFYVLGSRWSNEAPKIDAMGQPLGEDISNTEFLLQLNPSQTLFALEGDMLFGLGSYGAVLLSMRILWGLVAPWVLALMIAKTVSSRSTQSATGILYAACVMVLVAEATALYLGQVLGLKF